jgi:hypothetical protein
MNNLLMLSVIGIGVAAIVFLFAALALCVFWIWMLVSAIQNQGLNSTEKVVWVLVIIFLHFLGALLYYLLGHPKRLKTTDAGASR